VADGVGFVIAAGLVFLLAGAVVMVAGFLNGH
jgi:hypothetical protein